MIADSSHNSSLNHSSASAEPVIQHLAYRGYRLVQTLESPRERGTYIVQDNRHPEEGYRLVRGLSHPPAASSEPQRLSPHDLTTPALSVAAPPSDTFQIDGYTYLIRPYIQGQPLTWELPTGTGWSPDQVVRLLTATLQILHPWHQQGRGHGNLHPNNIIRQSDGQLILTDFSGDESPHINAPHVSSLTTNVLGQLGRLAYRVPNLDQPSLDIYALGILGIQYLLGRQPWSCETELAHLLNGLPCQTLVTILKGMVSGAPYNPQKILSDLVALEDNLGPLAADPREDSVSPENLPEDLPEILTTFNTLSTPSFSPVSSDSPPEDPQLTKPQLPQVSPTTAPPHTETEPSSALVHVPSTPVSLSHPDPRAAQGDLLWVPHRPDLAPRHGHRCLKWTAVLALASVGGIGVYYQQSSHHSHSEAIASSPPESPSPQQNTHKITQSSHPLPVPASPNSVSTAPKFSQTQENQYFARAYHHAKARDFSKALVYLEQVPTTAERYLEAQTKITEYQKKREIKAQKLLGNAYGQAAGQNFEQALAYLHQIPAHTEAHRIALEKIAEYRHKQQSKSSATASLG